MTISHNLKSAAAETGLSTTTLRAAIRAGALKAKSSSKDADGNPVGVLIIKDDELRAFIDGRPDA